VSAAAPHIIDSCWWMGRHETDSSLPAAAAEVYNGCALLQFEENRMPVLSCVAAACSRTSSVPRWLCWRDRLWAWLLTCRSHLLIRYCLLCKTKLLG
jgi:hypothetical protein